MCSCAPTARTVLSRRYGMDEAEAMRCGLCVVKLWAPVENTAYKHPLAMLDGSTIDMENETVRWKLNNNFDNGYNYQACIPSMCTSMLPRCGRMARRPLMRCPLSPLGMWWGGTDRERRQAEARTPIRGASAAGSQRRPRARPDLQ